MRAFVKALANISKSDREFILLYTKIEETFRNIAKNISILLLIQKQDGERKEY